MSWALGVEEDGGEKPWWTSGANPVADWTQRME